MYKPTGAGGVRRHAQLGATPVCTVHGKNLHICGVGTVATKPTNAAVASTVASAVSAADAAANAPALLRRRRRTIIVQAMHVRAAGCTKMTLARAVDRCCAGTSITTTNAASE